MPLTSPVRDLFQASNLSALPEDPSWLLFSRLLDAILEMQLASEQSVAAVSMVEVFKKPDGTSMGSDTMLVAIFPDSLGFAYEHGVLRKKINTQVWFYRDLGSLHADEDPRYHAGQGGFAIQAAGGATPILRLGWDWIDGGREPRTPETARAERDRILSSIREFTAG